MSIKDLTLREVALILRPRLGYDLACGFAAGSLLNLGLQILVRLTA